jgi:hypothetical protein
MVDGEALIRGVHLEIGIAVRQAYVRQALLLGQRLQFAMAVGDADRADVVALGEEQLENRVPVLSQALGVGAYLHALLYGGDAGRHQLVAALDFDQT